MDKERFIKSAELYFAANCNSFKNNQSNDITKDDDVILEFLKRAASQDIGWLSKDKDGKIATKKVSTDALTFAISEFKIKNYIKGREYLTNGVNSCMAIILGGAAYKLIVDGHDIYLKIINNSVDNFTHEEALLMETCGQALMKKAIEAKIVIG
ncbi:hypothetical protein [Limnohabitans sp. Jir72]|uniref:hypothetical protein n=1 Tax=Limnohabitans sp. Jir72 TaxID=1977909 RepID=UPI000D35AB64|nr:hypothetical protein [Limnohabitans sp. Jir72]PUE35780.1 hypothetical protein B9Z52_00950 [Limnohabitans sp. Jir72]